jgi:hypothetical protein
MSRKGMLEVVRLLRNHGAEDAAEDDQGRPPSHIAHVSSKIIVLRG